MDNFKSINSIKEDFKKAIHATRIKIEHGDPDYNYVGSFDSGFVAGCFCLARPSLIDNEKYSKNWMASIFFVIGFDGDDQTLWMDLRNGRRQTYGFEFTMVFPEETKTVAIKDDFFNTVRRTFPEFLVNPCQRRLLAKIMENLALKELEKSCIPQF